MASLNATAFRLTHVVKSIILSNNTISQHIQTSGNLLRLHNVRVYSNYSHTKPDNVFTKTPEVRKKTVPIAKVVLLSEEGKVMDQVTLEEAQHLAKRRNLNLVKIVDISLKTTLPTYKLMSKVQLLQERNTNKQKRGIEKNALSKATKDFIFSNKIEQHDLETKINKMIKLLIKHHKVRIYITTSPDQQVFENNIKLIETRLSENGTLSKTTKSASGIKLYFDPKIQEEGDIQIEEQSKDNKNNEIKKEH
ncbi:translation initiation factor IF-3 [Leptopilina heterotoma]|uniref:translation initiation factor IF-3 n=1 Tax=Leptopilina heterotoma TaxID=63436 RepID=UPI001CA8E017|nr:translation initiation factor IF-3 [Leptopilina heterotoma]